MVLPEIVKACLILAQMNAESERSPSVNHVWFQIEPKTKLNDNTCGMCCSSILFLVQFGFSIVLFYANI